MAINNGMPTLIIAGGDAAALLGTVGSVLHIFPETIGCVSALLGCAWFGTLLFDRWVNHDKAKKPEVHHGS